MPGLGVNIDHVATIRQARRTVEPDPIWAAAEAQLGGADCITFHLRKDRRHINDRDARLLREVVRCKLNMEMSLDEEILGIALEIMPDQASLVPENRQEITTEGGLDVVAHADRVAEVTAALRDAGVVVSAFIDPVAEQISASRQAGCQAIEIHTGTYANAWSPAEGGQFRATEHPRSPALGHGSVEASDSRSGERMQAALAEIRQGVRTGLDAGLIVHGGHGLTYDNIHPVAAIPGFTEFNIGHTIVSRSVFVGLREAVAEMKRLIDRAAAGRAG